MTVRTLRFDDLDPRTAYAVWRLRQDVFVVEQASPYPDLDGRDVEESTRHLLMEDDGRLVGYLRTLDDGDCVRVGRVVLAPEARGQGLGRRLMDTALDQVGDRESRLDAQTPMADWYARWGFTVDGPEFDDGGVAHLPMVRPAQQA